MRMLYGLVHKTKGLSTVLLTWKKNGVAGGGGGGGGGRDPVCDTQRYIVFLKTSV